MSQLVRTAAGRDGLERESSRSQQAPNCEQHNCRLSAAWPPSCGHCRAAQLIATPRIAFIRRPTGTAAGGLTHREGVPAERDPGLTRFGHGQITGLRYGVPDRPLPISRDGARLHGVGYGPRSTCYRQDRFRPLAYRRVMKSFARVPTTPPFGLAPQSHPPAVRPDRPACPDDDRVTRAGRSMTPTSMPATYCPQCGCMVGTLDGRRITHQVRFNEGWCKGGESSTQLRLRAAPLPPLSSYSSRS